MANLNDLTPGNWNIDAAHSTVGFVARHLMISKVRGSFGSFSGTVVVAAEPLSSTVTASVDIASISTGDEGRDSHLRGTDFFDAETHPTMVFVSTGIKDKGSAFVLTGDLTVKGVTKSVDFALEFDGVSPDPWGGTRVGFTAETEISRKEFGLEWNVALETGGVLVGDKVKIQLEIEAVRAA